MSAVKKIHLSLRKSELKAIHLDFAAITKEFHAIEALERTGESRATEAGNAERSCSGETIEAYNACVVPAHEIAETDSKIMGTVVREVAWVVVSYDYAKGIASLASKATSKTLKLWVKKMGEYVNGDSIRKHAVQAAITSVRG